MDPMTIDSKESVSKVEVKPTRQAGLVGVVMGALFLVFGGAMFVLIGRDEGVEMPVLVLFGTFWGIVCVILIVTSALHMRKGGLPMLRLERKEDHDPMERLRKLEGLRKDGLIDEMEFAAKRREIMTGKWQ